jgi:hypothetical protein
MQQDQKTKMDESKNQKDKKKEVGREYRYLINIIQMNRTLSDYVYILFM